MIPEEAIDAAAKALAAKMYNNDFDRMDDYTQGFLRDSARLSLEAAAPYTQAQAWEEGYLYSYDQERGGNGKLPIPVPEYLADDLLHWNPYMTAKEDATNGDG